MFRAGRVQAVRLLEIARLAEDTEPTYEDIGATFTGSLPHGFRHDHCEVALPGRDDVFDRAVEGLRRWAAHRGAGLAVEPQGPPTAGATVAVAAPVGPLTAVAVCRIVAVIDEPDRYGFAYGTLPGHPERGEESFVVERMDGRVVFRITAFSRPASPIARLGGPITRRIQRRTTRRYLSGMAEFVAASA